MRNVHGSLGILAINLIVIHPMLHCIITGHARHSDVALVPDLYGHVS
jgi:hypothetical protein